MNIALFIKNNLRFLTPLNFVIASDHRERGDPESAENTNILDCFEEFIPAKAGARNDGRSEILRCARKDRMEPALSDERFR